MYRILVAECKQEISTFNPVLTQYEDCTVHRGDELFAYHRGIESEIGGALEVFDARDDVELVPLWSANANSSGSMVQSAFDRLAEEFAAILTANKDGADAFYFSLHGAMGCTEELDPEGYLLQESRKILGPEIPIAISLAYAAIVITESFFGHSTARQREHYGDLPPIYQVYSMLGVIALGLIVHGCVRRHGRRRAAMDPLYRGAATDLTQAQLLLSSPDPRGRELSSPHEAGGPSAHSRRAATS